MSNVCYCFLTLTIAILANIWYLFPLKVKIVSHFDIKKLYFLHYIAYKDNGFGFASKAVTIFLYQLIAMSLIRITNTKTTVSLLWWSCESRQSN
jgi:hypothetical protein